MYDVIDNDGVQWHHWRVLVLGNYSRVDFNRI